MSLRKNRLRLVTFTALFAITLYFAFGYLQTFFVPQQHSLIQYNVNPEDSSTVANVYYAALGGRSGQQVGTARSVSQTNPLVASTLSKVITINTGKHVYEFNAEKTGDGRTFGLSIPQSSIGGYCWQKVAVKRDGVLIDTLKSWGDDTRAWDTREYFKSNNYIIYDDNSQNSGVRLRMDDLNEGNFYGRFYGNCRIFVNRYQLFYDNETLDIRLDVPTQTITPGQNISVNVVIENNLNVVITSGITTEFSVGTFLGPQRLVGTQTMALQPGENTLTFLVPAPAESEDIDVSVTANLSLTGNELQNLNYGDGILRLGDCFNTNSRGGCEEYRIYENSGASPTLTPERKADIGSFVELDTILEVQLSPGGGNASLRRNETGRNLRITNPPGNQLKPTPSPIISKGLGSYGLIAVLAVIIGAVILAGVLISKRRKKR